MKTKTSKPKKQIAQYPLNRKVVWVLTNGREISEVCANALIRNGWVQPQRDGLGLFDETQTYVALKP